MTDKEKADLAKKYGSSDDQKVRDGIEKKVIEHVVHIEGEPKGKDEEKEHLKNVVASLAQKQFEDYRRQLSEKTTDEELKSDILSVESPDELTYFEGLIEGRKSSSGGKPSASPTGKVHQEHIDSLSPKTDDWENGQEMVDGIYDKIESETFLKNRGEKYDVEGLTRAEQMADKLLESSITGMRARKHLMQLEGSGVGFCNNCGKTYVGGESDPCPYCGAKRGKAPESTRGIGTPYKGRWA
jgi:hypothetical protein